MYKEKKNLERKKVVIAPYSSKVGLSFETQIVYKWLIKIQKFIKNILDLIYLEYLYERTEFTSVKLNSYLFYAYTYILIQNDFFQMSYKPFKISFVHLEY